MAAVSARRTRLIRETSTSNRPCGSRLDSAASVSVWMSRSLSASHRASRAFRLSLLLDEEVTPYRSAPTLDSIGTKERDAYRGADDDLVRASLFMEKSCGGLRRWRPRRWSQRPQTLAGLSRLGGGRGRYEAG